MLFQKEIIAKGEDGTELTIPALCTSIRGLDLDKDDSGTYAVKKVLVDDHEIEIGIDSCFLHPTTKVFYNV